MTRWLGSAVLTLMWLTPALGAPPEHDGAPAAPGVPPVPAVPLPELVASDELITAQRGTLPVILSAPHGGGARVPGAVERKADGRYENVTVRDTGTERLTLLIVQRITERLNAKPSYVIAQFSRKDADANRPPGEAYESDAAKRHYDAYHRALATLVREGKAAYGDRVLLLDIHGQAIDKDAIYRGTRDGETCTTLLEREGAEGLVGPKSLLGRLAAKGYTIRPEKPSGDAAPEAKPPRGVTKWTATIGHETALKGGYIVFHYGSQNADGVDAIQLEIGGTLRLEQMTKTARDVGDAVAEWITEPGRADAHPAEP